MIAHKEFLEKRWDETMAGMLYFITRGLGASWERGANDGGGGEANE